MIEFAVVTTPSDPLPTDLAAAHAMILAQREMLTLAKSEVTVGRLEIERLKLMLAKARREQFGQSSERGRLLVEQLELAIEDLEETQAEEETKAEIAAPEAPRRSAPTIRGRLARHCRTICRSNGSSNPRLAPAANAAASGCASSARWCRRRWNASRGAGRSSSMCARSSRAGIARRSPSRRRRPIRSPADLQGRACSRWCWSQVPAASAAEPPERGLCARRHRDRCVDARRLGRRLRGGARPDHSGARAHVLSAERIHADDTTVPVLAKLKTVTGRIWTYVRDDRPFGGKDPPAAVF